SSAPMGSDAVTGMWMTNPGGSSSSRSAMAAQADQSRAGPKGTARDGGRRLAFADHGERVSPRVGAGLVADDAPAKLVSLVLGEHTKGVIQLVACCAGVLRQRHLPVRRREARQGRACRASPHTGPVVHRGDRKTRRLLGCPGTCGTGHARPRGPEESV